jgi:hypothetical protein
MTLPLTTKSQPDRGCSYRYAGRRSPKPVDPPLSPNWPARPARPDDRGSRTLKV